MLDDRPFLAAVIITSGIVGIVALLGWLLVYHNAVAGPCILFVVIFIAVYGNRVGWKGF